MHSTGGAVMRVVRLVPVVGRRILLRNKRPPTTYSKILKATGNLIIPGMFPKILTYRFCIVDCTKQTFLLVTAVVGMYDCSNGFSVINSKK